jgi:hypothetical protein
MRAMCGWKQITNQTAVIICQDTELRSYHGLEFEFSMTYVGHRQCLDNNLLHVLFASLKTRVHDVIACPAKITSIFNVLICHCHLQRHKQNFLSELCMCKAMYIHSSLTL